MQNIIAIRINTTVLFAIDICFEFLIIVGLLWKIKYTKIELCCFFESKCIIKINLVYVVN